MKARSLEAIRDEIAELDVERKSIGREPRTREETRAALLAFATARSEALDRWTEEFASAFPPTSLIAPTVDAVAGYTPGGADMGAVFGIAPETFVKARLARLDEQGFPFGRPVHEKRAALERITSRLFALELAEEDEVRRLIEAGQSVVRRADIENPIVLVLRRDAAPELAA